MSIDKKTVARAAHLARMELDADSETAMVEQLNNILQLVDELQSVPTENVSPMAHPLDLQQPLREDEVTNVDARETLMANSPAQSGGLFLVPKVIE